ncbi:uncharacterized protein LOC114785854 isoform X1 [Denticeps clupeoides]|uniref:uncharacterized protein LOC114785854 isoform X1 n=1 Tax=Denticeps clupeoides TaxID=299321 RepID=UPI0010A51E9C|nr:uncharacterized protein LOC114785854 isoform X1 [Denticeps clupeoides]
MADAGTYQCAVKVPSIKGRGVSVDEFTVDEVELDVMEVSPKTSTVWPSSSSSSSSKTPTSSRGTAAPQAGTLSTTQPLFISENFSPTATAQTGAVMGWSVILIVFLVCGITLLIFYKNRKSRKQRPASPARSGRDAEMFLPDCEYEEIKDTGDHSETADTTTGGVSTAAQLLTNPSEGDIYSTIQLHAGASTESDKYASIIFHKKMNVSDSGASFRDETSCIYSNIGPHTGI